MAPTAIEYTKKETKKSARNQNAKPTTFAGDGLAPTVAPPCRRDIIMLKGTEIAAGMAMIPTKSEKLRR